MFFDTHAHYDDSQFDSDRDTLLSSMPENGVNLILNPGTDTESSLKSIELAKKYPFIYCAVGYHPHEADKMTHEEFEKIAQMLKHPRVRAIGEIGLDYHYDFASHEEQISCFRKQLELARETGKPVIIHDREAHEDCINILSEYPEVRGVFHCYSGSLEMARLLIKRGWYLSFTGAITFKNARRALEVISEIPAERIMIETDSPYLSPVPLRGKRNDSRNLPYIADVIAKCLGISVEDAAKLCFENGKRFFDI